MRRATFREVDIVAGAVLAAFGVFVLFQGLRLDFYADGVPGPGFFPTLLALALIISGAVLALTRTASGGEVTQESPLPSRQQARRSLGLWVAILAACLSVGALGFPLAMLLLVAVILLLIERQRKLGSVAAVVAIPLLAWLLFASLLQVPLPLGPFGS